jgi:thiamine pyrophosphate-dependent acetolactate synthase large subunit-like protein
MVKLAAAFDLEAMSVNSNSLVPDAFKFLLRKTDLPLLVELKVDPEDLPAVNLQGSLIF